MRDITLSLVISSLLFSAPASALAAGERVLVTNTRDGTLSVISRDTHEVITTIPAGRKANRLSLAPDGRHAYVINDGSAFVRVFDTHTLKFVRRVRAGR
ncbi:MAG: hypothetical protein OXL41_11605, partial [Nitrospinae bacterium]|nr:hypothetical protein [Nitrospinota bacterium]